MTIDELSTQKIIDLLKKALKDENLDPYLKNLAPMCINYLNSDNDEERQKGRMGARPIIAPYVNLTPRETCDDSLIAYKTIKERAKKYAEEINEFLATRNLTDYIKDGLTTVLCTLTDENASYEELTHACFLYGINYQEVAKLSPILNSSPKRVRK